MVQKVADPRVLAVVEDHFPGLDAAI